MPLEAVEMEVEVDVGDAEKYLAVQSKQRVSSSSSQKANQISRAKVMRIQSSD